MKILVTGSKGQLGSEIRELASLQEGLTFFFTDVEDLDICDKVALENFISSKKITSIINCAAYTAVDKAETERELANKINHTAVGHLAEVAKEYQVQLIHISTDYVFAGTNFIPYDPYEATAPVNEYGRSKLAGENAIRAVIPDKSLIIRTSWVYSSYGNNFVKTMLRLGQERSELNVIADQVGVPTYAGDLAKFIVEKALYAQHSGVEVYHYTNEGVCSWFDFAREIMAAKNLNCVVKPIPTTAYPTPAKRPYYSLMDKASLKNDFEVEIPYWKDSLKTCLQLLKE